MGYSEQDVTDLLELIDSYAEGEHGMMGSIRELKVRADYMREPRFKSRRVTMGGENLQTTPKPGTVTDERKGLIVVKGGEYACLVEGGHSNAARLRWTDKLREATVLSALGASQVVREDGGDIMHATVNTVVKPNSGRFSSTITEVNKRDPKKCIASGGRMRCMDCRCGLASPPGTRQQTWADFSS